ncbi:MAG: hypothetical protein AB1467_00280 [Candidatus Diapherotrites archaeon]
MVYVNLDKLGKIYFPKILRKKMKSKEFIALVLPDGDIVLHKLEKSKDPLKEFQKLPKISKSLKQVRKEILEEAMKEVG